MRTVGTKHKRTARDKESVKLAISAATAALQTEQDSLGQTETGPSSGRPLMSVRNKYQSACFTWTDDFLSVQGGCIPPWGRSQFAARDEENNRYGPPAGYMNYNKVRPKANIYTSEDPLKSWEIPLQSPPPSSADCPGTASWDSKLASSETTSFRGSEGLSRLPVTQDSVGQMGSSLTQTHTSILRPVDE